MADLRKSFLLRLDWQIVILYLLFVFFGWINIYSATHQEVTDFNLISMDSRAGKQFVFILAAFFLAIIMLLIDSKFWAFLSYPLYGVSMLLLIVVLIAGREINGARSWFIIGPFNLQPSEFAKIAVVVMYARLFSTYGFNLKTRKNIAIAFSVLLLPSFLILLQNDTGSSLVFFALMLVLFREGLNETFLVITVIAIVLFILTLLMTMQTLIAIISGFVLLMVALRNNSFKIPLMGFIFMLASGSLVLGANKILQLNIPLERLLLIAALLTTVVSVYFAYKRRIRNLYFIAMVWFGAILLVGSVDYMYSTVLEEHQQSRINQVLGIDHDPLGAGYNLNQSKIAIGSGGFSGKGFLKGTQTRFDFVPEQSTDFIFCTVGEEWGFLGSTLLIVLFSWFLIRLVIMAERQRSAYSRVFGYGVFSIFFFHFVVNIGMTIGLVPVIGIPLPFFSYGGSSLWSFTVLLFIFLHLDTDRFEVVS